ncbi:MAG TPA: Hpt domain-containing protein [Caulobacterales bacterium]|nr:Hpt domain-containing protein [Caulobacterales bacterium]
MAEKLVTLIDPTRAAPPRLALKSPVFDAEAVARADQALQSMSGSFQLWLDEEVARLQTARLSAVAADWSNDALDILLIAAHDLKGMGATYDYPLVSQIAGSLCRLIDCEEGRAAARAKPSLVFAHVDAIRAAARDGVRTDAHAVGQALLHALEMQVDALGLPLE